MPKKQKLNGNVITELQISSVVIGMVVPVNVVKLKVVGATEYLFVLIVPNPLKVADIEAVPPPQAMFIDVVPGGAVPSANSGAVHVCDQALLPRNVNKSI